MNFDLKLYQQTWQTINRDSPLPNKKELKRSISLSVYDCLDSTNTKLWQLIDSGVAVPVGAIALQQTAGKGQWGRSWVSAEGGLYLSVGLNLNLNIGNYSHLVMATVWGIARVLRHYQLPVTIKWSNDLILQRRKLGGIKIETRNLGDKLTQAIVGVGINWCNSVPEPGINLASYYRDKPQKIHTLEELTAIAAYGILLGYKYYLAVGIERLLTEYLTILDSLGKRVKIDGNLGEVTGVTAKGKLRVKLRSPGASTEIDLAPGQISLGYEYP